MVLSEYPDAKVVLFGSAGSQLSVLGSDIDVLISAPTANIKELYCTMHKRLINEDWTVFAQMIMSQVPLIKIRDAETGIKADICFNQENGSKGLLYALSMQVSFPELRPLYFILKVFLQER